MLGSPFVLNIFTEILSLSPCTATYTSSTSEAIIIRSKKYKHRSPSAVKINVPSRIFKMKPLSILTCQNFIKKFKKHFLQKIREVTWFNGERKYNYVSNIFRNTFYNEKWEPEFFMEKNQKWHWWLESNKCSLRNIGIHHYVLKVKK